MSDIVERLRGHFEDKDTDAWMSCAEAADEITRLRAENERLHKGLTNLIAACDAGRLVEHGAGGMTLQSQMMGSTINRVSAWAVELARAALEGDSE